MIKYRLGGPDPLDYCNAYHGVRLVPSPDAAQAQDAAQGKEGKEGEAKDPLQDDGRVPPPRKFTLAEHAIPHWHYISYARICSLVQGCTFVVRFMLCLPIAFFLLTCLFCVFQDGLY